MIDNFSNDIYSANIYFFGFIPQINGKFLPSIRGLNHPAQALSAAPYTGTYINIRKLPAGFMNISRKMFLHANRRTAAPDISVSGRSSFTGIRSHFLLPEAFAASFRSTSCSPGMTQTK